jgi:hypothetical protein
MANPRCRLHNCRTCNPPGYGKYHAQLFPHLDSWHECRHSATPLSRDECYNNRVLQVHETKFALSFLSTHTSPYRKYTGRCDNDCMETRECRSDCRYRVLKLVAPPVLSRIKRQGVCELLHNRMHRKGLGLRLCKSIFQCSDSRNLRLNNHSNGDSAGYRIETTFSLRTSCFQL